MSSTSTEQSSGRGRVASFIELPSPRCSSRRSQNDRSTWETTILRRITPNGYALHQLAEIVIPSIEVPTPSPTESTNTTIVDEDELPPPLPKRPWRAAIRPALRTSFRNFSSIATVIVGEPDSKTCPQTTYLVHKDLLASASPYFAAALSGAFAESTTQKVHLPNEKPELFEWFLQWLYTGTLTTQPTHSDIIPYPSFSRNSHSPTSPHPFPNSPTHLSHLNHPATSPRHLDGDLRNTAGSPKYFLLIDLWALGDRLCTTPFSNHVLSTLARLSESTNSVPTPSDTWLLYDEEVVRASSPLRKLVLDLFAYKRTDRLLATHPDEWHPGFMRDLVVRCKRPGSEALERHEMEEWRVKSWGHVVGCSACGEVVRPGTGGVERCGVCGKVVCGECLRKFEVEGWVWGLDTTGCKPWMGRGMCTRYHEHDHGAACG